MAIYRSIFTGQQIDEMLSLLKDKGLDNVIGIVERDSEGNFIAADISWIPDISETVSSVDYDPVNTKITKTINGTTSDIVSVATLKTDFGVGQADGIVPLNSSRKIDATYLPSYVDDVIEGYYYNDKFYEESTHTTEIVGEGGKIYIDLVTNRTYRWGGSTYVEVSPGTVITVVRDLVTGTKTATITVDGVGYDLYAPTPPVVSLNFAMDGSDAKKLNITFSSI